MVTSGVLRITIDTNVCNLIADPLQYANLVKPGTVERLRAAITEGRIKIFMSEASVFVECFSFADKLNYLAVAGTSDPRPTLDPRRRAIFEKLSTFDVRMLHAPLIAAEKFIDFIPWADDEVFTQTERLDRFHQFIRQYPRHHPLITLGENKLKNQPPVPRDRSWTDPDGSWHTEMRQGWAVALKREYDTGDEVARKTLRKQAEPLIGEWCDELIVGSHTAYGNDIFCTTDRGKNAGGKSLLHESNRAALARKGIKIASPEEVTERL